MATCYNYVCIHRPIEGFQMKGFTTHIQELTTFSFLSFVYHSTFICDILWQLTFFFYAVAIRGHVCHRTRRQQHQIRLKRKITIFHSISLMHFIKLAMLNKFRSVFFSYSFHFSFERMYIFFKELCLNVSRRWFLLYFILFYSVLEILWE